MRHGQQLLHQGLLIAADLSVYLGREHVTQNETILWAKVQSSCDQGGVSVRVTHLAGIDVLTPAFPPLSIPSMASGSFSSVFFHCRSRESTRESSADPERCSSHCSWCHRCRLSLATCWLMISWSGLAKSLAWWTSSCFGCKDELESAWEIWWEFQSEGDSSLARMWIFDLGYWHRVAIRRLSYINYENKPWPYNVPEEDWKSITISLQ
jgi:hypothetical protein